MLIQIVLTPVTAARIHQRKNTNLKSSNKPNTGISCIFTASWEPNGDQKRLKWGFVALASTLGLNTHRLHGQFDGQMISRISHILRSGDFYIYLKSGTRPRNAKNIDFGTTQL